MKTKAELIQASNNLATNVPIYTFLLTYPVKNWFLDFFGLSKYEFFAKRLTTSYYVTGTDIRVMMNQARAEAKRSVHCALTDQMNEIVSFSREIFDKINPKNPGARINGYTAKKAIDLFGPRLQEVLKQYNPGEIHDPPGMSAGHIFTALPDNIGLFDGWQKRYPLT